MKPSRPHPGRALVIVVAACLSACSRGDVRTRGDRLGEVAVVLAGGDVAGYARAFEPRPFVFPTDHGAHPDFRSEWWYFTGNLTTADGRRFGYDLTFFRAAVAPPGVSLAGDSPWRTRQVWMAHFAIADVAGGTVHAAERFERGALGLAGAETGPFRVWLDDWAARSAQPDALFPLTLHAADGDVAVELTLDPGKPVVLQGDDGLSRKSAAPGNASYYYSFTRLPVRGAVTTGGTASAVTGLGWIDRESGHQRARSGPDRMGLVLAAARRPARADVLSAAPQGRLRRSAQRRHAGRAGCVDAPSRRRRRRTRAARALDQSA